MKASNAVLICLMMLVIFSYTTATIRPLIQQDNSFIPEKKTALYNSLKASPKDKPRLIGLGDPIEDPIPDTKKN